MTPELIASTLRGELMSGRLRPGEPLPQVALAERFDVSRIPIRDALRILAGEGLVHFDTSGGARAIELTAEEVRELFDLRVMLECDCLRRAVDNLSPGALQEIDRIRRQSDLEAEAPGWSAGDWAFHESIYRHSGRMRQVAMIAGLRHTSQLFVAAYWTMPAKKPRWLSAHKSILDSLRRGDVDDAVEALRNHLETAATHLPEQLTLEPTFATDCSWPGTDAQSSRQNQSAEDGRWRLRPATLWPFRELALPARSGRSQEAALRQAELCNAEGEAPRCRRASMAQTWLAL